MTNSRLFAFWALIALVVAASLAAGILWARADSNSGLQVPSANTISHAGAEGHVSGEVAEPGVYALTEGDRVADAIAAAGGATDKADLSAVNMALAPAG